MPAPDNLAVQTPGQAATQPTTSTEQQTEPKEPEYSAKHNGGGRWKIWAASTDDWFSDFVAAGEGAKAAAQAEAERLNAGGEPFTKPADPELVTTAAATPAAAQAEASQAQRRTQAVLTDEGWLVPDLPVAYTRE